MLLADSRFARPQIVAVFSFSPHSLLESVSITGAKQQEVFLLLHGADDGAGVSIVPEAGGSRSLSLSLSLIKHKKRRDMNGLLYSNSFRDYDDSIVNI